MPIQLDVLLAPITPESPSGPDLSYDPSFQEVETMVLGKPETQFSAAEPPEWNQIRKKSEELLGRTKHLRTMVALLAALVRTEGLSGCRDGLLLLDGTVRKYWDSVYPLLDPDDYNDPTERLNIIAAISIPVGTVGDPYNIVDALRQAPLSASPQMGRFSLHELQRSQAGGEEGGKPAAPLSQVEASFRDTPPEVLTTALGLVEESQALVKGLVALLGETVESGRVPNFDVLTNTLREMQRLLSGYSGGAGAAEAASVGEAAGGETLAVAAPVARPVIAGAINNREDVLRALDAINRYYAEFEPSSPVPLLIERAKRAVPMDFLSIMQDWVPDSMGQVNLIAGIR
jgi:type VI secretion system protein ImpA